MGADFQVRQVLKTAAKNLDKWHADLVRTEQHENGHGGYTGSFAESPGLTITKEVFNSYRDAKAWLSKNCEKWENSQAVTVIGVGGDEYWLVGGVFSC